MSTGTIQLLAQKGNCCIPDSGDKRGQDELLLKKYIWYGFFTDRYENSAATHAYEDFGVQKRIISPDALLKESGIHNFLALNCALIADKTNISIGRKDPTGIS